MKREPLAPVLALALGAAGTAWADDPDAAMGRRLQEALRARGAEVHRCYAEALDRDPQVQGEILFQIEIGAADRVRRAEALKAEVPDPELSACLLRSISAWTLPQLRAAPGDRVVFPLVFRPDPPARSNPRKGGGKGRAKVPRP